MGFLMRIDCLFVYLVIPLIVLLLGVDIVYCRMPYSDDQSIYPSYYGNLEDSIKSALQKLEHAPKWASGWVPESATNLGQVSGVALNNDGNLLVFHRASNVWDQTTFNMKNVYQSIGEPPIPQPTIYIYNDTGNLIDVWGKNLFYIPHGITVDHDGNVWLTDVALHQVFKFTPDNREKPAMVLGEKFVPGTDDSHFCKPSAVAVLASGEFFVADGYCNTRIIKYSANGTRLLTWGRPNVRQQVPGYQPKQSPYSFNLPHALALAEDRGLVCVADRENGRVGCFRTDDGTHVASYHSWMFGGTVYSVAYSPVQGGRLYVVNGMTAARVRGYVLELESGRLRATFAPEGDFTAPHDIVVSPDGSRVYVAEINPYRVTKFTDESLALVNGNSTSPVRRVAAVVPAPVKPTTTIEASGASWSWEWWRVCGLGAGGALSVAAAAAALCAARRRLAAPPGRKGVTRRRWEYGQGQFKLRRLLERRRFTRVHSDDSDEEPAPMLPPQPPATA